MHRVRAFFYVCAGLLCLALSYHLGARTATAQAGGAIVAAGIEQGPVFSAAVGRTVYAANSSGTVVARPPVPGTEAIVAVGGGIPGGGVILANGDMYSIPNGGAWSYVGNLTGGATPASAESFGAMKSRYRDEPRATQPAPQDR